MKRPNSTTKTLRTALAAAALMIFALATAPAANAAPQKCPNSAACVGGMRFVAINYAGAESGVEVTIANAANPTEVLGVFSNVAQGDQLYVDLDQAGVPSDVDRVVFLVTDGGVPLEATVLDVSCGERVRHGDALSDRLDLVCYDSRTPASDDACRLDCNAELACSPDPEVCDDGRDNNDDGLVDCDDSDCVGDPACELPTCSTATDCRGGVRFLSLMYDGTESGVTVTVVDAADTSRVAGTFDDVQPGDVLNIGGAGGMEVLPLDLTFLVTANGVPLPLERTDLHISCSETLTPGQDVGERMQLLCFDSIDVEADDVCRGDCDGLLCAAAFEDCGDGIDNDGDGLVDCADDDCAAVPCDDGSNCTADDVCTAGVCAGSPLDCDDGVDCTVDACDAAAGCTNGADDALCDDGDYCNGVESCSDAGCEAGREPCAAGTTCDEAADLCVVAGCTVDADCDDGDVCNGAETCDATGACATGEALVCDDGVFCNGAELCDAATGCVEGPLPVCDDGVDCTEDYCDLDSDSCTKRARNRRCSDGVFCNGKETCDATVGCVAAAPVDCNDDVSCTVDTCNEDTDRCDNTADDARCDDGVFCNGVETCDERRDCEAAAAPVDCSPFDTECLVAFCDEAADSCNTTAFNEGGSCDDGDFCTATSECREGACLASSGSCGDGILQPICGEECDDPDDPNCTATCVALAGACGNGILEGAEVCERPSLEICDDRADNDGDGLTDCADPDCTGGSQIDPAPSCNGKCQEVSACKPILDDPSIIRITGDPTRDYFKFHGRVLAHPDDIDPAAGGIGLVVSNEEHVIFRGELLPGDMKCKNLKCKFKDNGAKRGRGVRDGIFKVGTRFKKVGGEWSYVFTFQVVADMSKATLPRITTQVYGVDDVGFLTSDWTRKGSGWILRLKDAVQVEY